MKRKRWLSRHHLCPKSRGGKDNQENIFILWNQKHEAWHILFGNRTIPEIIEILKRIEEARCVRWSLKTPDTIFTA